ncbi:MAG: imidazolonepropionase [Spirosomataceae bacterium]|jgi:imidazolonepropionase
MLIINIKSLAGIHSPTQPLRGQDLGVLPSIENAFLRIENDVIVEFGEMASLVKSEAGTVDATGQFVLPAWCDSHTHLVFAGSRETEFIDKIKGVSYEKIAQNGGGILNSARRLNQTSEDELYESALIRLQKIMAIGTGAVEIKSGYGLSVEGELKMLRVIKRLKKTQKIPIKATFLGAHAIPAEFKENREGYLQLIESEMLPKIAEEKLADYIDVFCETGFFDTKETTRILKAGKRYGLKAKVHANQLNNSGGVQVGIQCDAVSVDHLECIGDEEINVLATSKTMATLLPSAAFFLRLSYPPARKLIENNAAIAIATDFNPGSSPSGNMPLLIAMSCIQMRLTPEEAINAATINGAFAMEVANEVGSITVGKKANLIFTKQIPSLAYLPYSFGENLIDKVMTNGEFQ